jgi:hypothetical protein
MILRCAALAAIGVVTLVQSAGASPSPKATAPLNCPSAAGMKPLGLDASLKDLDARLTALEKALAVHEAARDRALEGVRAETERAINQARLSPEQVDAIVARAVAQARAEARAAASAERAVEAIKPQLDALRKRLESRDGDSASDSPPASDGPVG